MDQTVFICVTCRGPDSDTHRPGRELFEAVAAAISNEIAVTPVECLSVCKRPCTLALAAPGKWTYVIGDLNHRDHLEDIVTSARRYGETTDGIIPWRERPQSFRKFVVARIPPAGFIAKTS